MQVKLTSQEESFRLPSHSHSATINNRILSVKLKVLYACVLGGFARSFRRHAPLGLIIRIIIIIIMILLFISFFNQLD